MAFILWYTAVYGLDIGITQQISRFFQITTINWCAFNVGKSENTRLINLKTHETWPHDSHVPIEIQNKRPLYRLGTVNWKSLISKDLIGIKWKYKLNYAL